MKTSKEKLYDLHTPECPDGCLMKCTRKEFEEDFEMSSELLAELDKLKVDQSMIYINSTVQRIK